MIQKTFRQMCLAAACFGLAATGISACSGSQEESREPAKAKNTGSFEREGLKVDFSIVSTQNDRGAVVESEMTRIQFKITDAETGEPVSGLYPAAWIDPVASTDDVTDKQCRQKAGLYLSGYIGVRPMIDLNSYYVVVLNSDPTIAVIDPIVGIKGITKLLTQIILPARGTDWSTSTDQKRVYVAMPSVDSVAVIDLDTFHLEATVSVGDEPDRIATQPDGRYVWVGRTGRDSGVSVIDTETNETVAEIETGEGHHEMAFTADNRFAFITNRLSKSVSVVDIRTLELVDEIALEGAPISIAYSDLSEAIYVADGVTGTITAFDPETRAPRGTVVLAPGLGPMKITPDGRYAFATNAAENAVFIIDTATNSLVHEAEIDGKPFQVSFSRNFAFIRALETARVSMIKLSEIGGGGDLPIMGFNAGERAPQDSPTLLPSSLFASAVTEAATLAVSPADATIYYYMEGMNAPMGNFRNYGHRPLSALVADRTIKEVAPGEYVSLVKMPSAGNFQLIMTMDSPQLIECFPFVSDENPLVASDEAPLGIEYATRSGQMIQTGEEFAVTFTLTDSASEGAAYIGDDVTAITYRAPGEARMKKTAKHLGDGRYEVRINPDKDGVYYVYPIVLSKGMTASALPFISVIAREDTGQAAGGQQ